MRTDVAERDAWHAILPDRGCEVAPSCLACPLESCIHDVGVRSRVLTQGRIDAVRESDRLMLQGWTLGEIAQQLHVSTRTLMRWRAVARGMASAK